MRDGGLGAIFFSIWLPSKITGAPAVQKALDQIDAVREQVRNHPKDLTLATTAGQIREAHKDGKIAALLGVEGGHMIANNLGILRMYAALGVRYMTLTHSGNDEWADSSTDKPVHDGLTDFGKDVVREMNRLGVIVDISPGVVASPVICRGCGSTGRSLYSLTFCSPRLISAAGITPCRTSRSISR